MKSRVQALLVVPQQPVHGLVLGGASGFEFQAMQALHLQRAKHGLAARVIPAVAAAAHGTGDAVNQEGISEVETGVLTSPVTMKQQP